MALQGTAVGQECIEQEATNVEMEFVGVKEEPFDEESGIVAKTEVIIKEERDEDYTKRVCEKDEEEFLDAHMAPRPLHSAEAVQVEPTRSSLELHHADNQYQQQHKAPSLDESQVKPTQDKNHNGKLPAVLETMTSASDNLSAKKKEGIKRPKRRKQQISLHAKLLESQLELVKIMNKNAELERKIKNAILEEQLKQEELKSRGLQ